MAGDVAARRRVELGGPYGPAQRDNHGITSIRSGAILEYSSFRYGGVANAMVRPSNHPRIAQHMGLPSRRRTRFAYTRRDSVTQTRWLDQPCCPPLPSIALSRFGRLPFAGGIDDGLILGQQRGVAWTEDGMEGTKNPRGGCRQRVGPLALVRSVARVGEVRTDTNACAYFLPVSCHVFVPVPFPLAVHAFILISHVRVCRDRAGAQRGDQASNTPLLPLAIHRFSLCFAGFIFHAGPFSSHPRPLLICFYSIGSVPSPLTSLPLCWALFPAPARDCHAKALPAPKKKRRRGVVSTFTSSPVLC